MPGIEGLRALAAGSIVALHCWLYSHPAGERLGRGGWTDPIFESLALGVTLFFCLSGFLLYRPFAAAIARGLPRPGVREYFLNRALRIAPAYWVILLVTALVLGGVRIRDASGDPHGRITDPAVLGQTALLVQNLSPGTLGVGIGPAWSLAVEVVFYLSLPLLAILAASLAGTRPRPHRVMALLAPPVLLLLVGLSGKYVAANVVGGAPLAGWSADWHSVIERSFWAQADLFSFGMVVAVLHTEVADGRLRLPSGWRPTVLAAAAILLVVCAWRFDGAQLSYVRENTLAALALAMALATVVIREPGTRRPWRPVRLLEAAPLTAAGVVSYSLFLWHEPLQLWLTDRGLTAAGWAGLGLNLLVILALAGALSAATYRFVEAPALRRKRRSARVPEPPEPPEPVPAQPLRAAS
jgi:peptidoglycan/LPS O-acetylase OafA/YrhL